MLKKNIIQHLKLYSIIYTVLLTTLFCSISAITVVANTDMTSSLKIVVLTQGIKKNEQEAFSFITIGDFNEGGCARNDRVNKLVLKIAAEESDAAFYISTGDIIDGYLSQDIRPAVLQKILFQVLEPTAVEMEFPMVIWLLFYLR